MYSKFKIPYLLKVFLKLHFKQVNSFPKTEQNLFSFPYLYDLEFIYVGYLRKVYY